MYKTVWFRLTNFRKIVHDGVCGLDNFQNKPNLKPYFFFQKYISQITLFHPRFDEMTNSLILSLKKSHFLTHVLNFNKINKKTKNPSS